jgi:hypothetical protein
MSFSATERFEVFGAAFGLVEVLLEVSLISQTRFELVPSIHQFMPLEYIL